MVRVQPYSYLLLFKGRLQCNLKNSITKNIKLDYYFLGVIWGLRARKSAALVQSNCKIIWHRILLLSSRNWINKMQVFSFDNPSMRAPCLLFLRHVRAVIWIYPPNFSPGHRCLACLIIVRAEFVKNMSKIFENLQTHAHCYHSWISSFFAST